MSPEELAFYARKAMLREKLGDLINARIVFAETGQLNPRAAIRCIVFQAVIDGSDPVLHPPSSSPLHAAILNAMGDYVADLFRELRQEWPL